MQKYVPILKGKLGEYGALGELKEATRKSITPVIEIPPVPYDFVEDAPSKSLNDHIGPIPGQIEKYWGQDAPILLDSHLVDDGNYESLESVCSRAISIGINAIPVVTANELSGLGSIKPLVRRSGACLRIGRDQVDDENLNEDIETILAKLDLSKRKVDLLLDLGELSEKQTSIYVMAIMGMVMSIEAVGDFRSLTLASAAFPANLSGIEGDSFETVQRRDWDLWQSVVKRGKSLPLQPCFGDYAICSPEIPSLDPRIMSPSASIRYTADTHWLIVKGKAVRRYGYQQFPELCRALRGHADYKGEDFSWGDRYIADCANDSDGPGNLTTWRKVATNHHIELVVSQLASLGAS